jgi:hypothetical protein
MSMAYDPYPDAIAFLSRRSPLERHAIARVMDVDGKALAILHWLADQPDCDLATAAMIFWRVRSLPPKDRSIVADTSSRRMLLEAVTQKVLAGQYDAPTIAWDGREAWSREPLIGATPFGDASGAAAIPAAFFGPFSGDRTEPATHAFFDEPYDEDDIFDSLWRVDPKAAAAADWLSGRPAHVWMAAVEGLLSGHPDDVFEWMLRQPECPRSVAGQIFWLWGHEDVTLPVLEGRSAHSDELVALVLERWRAGNLAACELDFSRYATPEHYRALAQKLPSRGGLDVFVDLLAPRPGQMPTAIDLDDDFDYWLLRVSHTPRPRAAAIAEWKADRSAEAAAAKSAAAPPTLLERLFYGGKFTGAKSQVDRCWKQFNVVMLSGGLLLIALMRGGAPKAAFWVFLALAAVLSVYQSSANLGSYRRIIGWWVGAFALAIGLAFLFRRIDKGII